jgi:hypothetical protein
MYFPIQPGKNFFDMKSLRVGFSNDSDNLRSMDGWELILISVRPEDNVSLGYFDQA